MIVAIMVGLFSIVAGLARAGFIASFLSRPILVGYLNGIGLSLLVGQLGKLFGYEARPAASSPASSRCWGTCCTSIGRR